jgi:hypothetical protein
LFYCTVFPLVLNVKQIKAYANTRGNANLANNRVSDNLVAYLAGLIEGDGSLLIPDKERGPSGKLRVASIQVIFAIKDKPSALLLQSKFGGNVYDHPSKNLTRWMIQDIKSVTRIVEGINGKFRTPKINALHKMIDFLNARGANIAKLPLDTSPLNNNA